MIVKTFGSAVQGVEAISIVIEVNVSPKGVRFSIVGLPDNAVKESEQRIESAITSMGFRFPRFRTIVNMAPANIRKAGSSYDLPIALALLTASKQIEGERLDQFTIMGELSLDGAVLPVRGALAIALQAKRDGFKGIILPLQNAEEAAMVDGLQVYGVSHLQEVITFLLDPGSLTSIRANFRKTMLEATRQDIDFSEVKGQYFIKRGMEIAAAGGHNLVLIGPPGSGKTMLARRLRTILPPMTLSEALETTKIHSVAGKLSGLITQRPFRSPHHTISDTALVGGGTNPQPGEISLAHNGVLFLDELPEFKRSVLELMRQPIEERKVTISRASGSADFPTNFMLVAAMNPCPCGFYNHPDKDCTCPPGAVYKYMSRISGPLMDRIDMHIEVTPVSVHDMTDNKPGECSADIRHRVMQARDIQTKRFAWHPGMYANAQISGELLKTFCDLDPAGSTLLKNAMLTLKLSARAYDRILKVSRTIADLAACEQILSEHIAEAIRFRSLDRENWWNK